MCINETDELTANWTQYDSTYVCYLLKNGEEIHSREYDHAHAWDEMQQDVSVWLDGADTYVLLRCSKQESI